MRALVVQLLAIALLGFAAPALAEPLCESTFEGIAVETVEAGTSSTQCRREESSEGWSSASAWSTQSVSARESTTGTEVGRSAQSGTTRDETESWSVECTFASQGAWVQSGEVWAQALAGDFVCAYDWGHVHEFGARGVWFHVTDDVEGQVSVWRFHDESPQGWTANATYVFAGPVFFQISDAQVGGQRFCGTWETATEEPRKLDPAVCEAFSFARDLAFSPLP